MSSNMMTLIEKLTGRENYPTWKFAVQTYLEHEELWDCITTENPDVKKDTKAKSKIILLVDPINYVHIQEARTAKAVWQNLEKAFDDNGLTRRVGLLRDLITTTLESCMNIEDYAKDTCTRRSLTGYVFIKNGAAITWATQRQQSVALSTTEAEFMAACSATKEAIWLKRLLMDIDELKQESICLNIDNQSAICLIKNVDYHKRCKHIDIKYNFIKDKYKEKQIDLNYVCTKEQYADMFTKALPRDRFQYLRRKIGVQTLK